MADLKKTQTYGRYQRIWNIDTDAESEVSEDEINTDTIDYTVSISKTSLELNKGESLQLDAAVKDNKGNAVSDAAISWVSLDESTATVEDGKVTAVAEGEATICAAYLGKKAECTVTVKNDESDTSDDDPVTPSDPDTPESSYLDTMTKVSDTEYTLNLATKQKYLISDLAKTKADGKNYKIAYSSASDKKTAALSTKGLITAKKAGTASILLTKGEKQIKITVNVYDPQFTYTNAKQKYFTVNIGETVTPAYNDCKLKPVFSIPASCRVATINSETGELTPKGKGTVKVTATVGEGKLARKVTTKVVIYDPVIKAGKGTVMAGKTLKASVKNGAKATTWSSLNPEIATIDSKGKITGVKAGTVTIQAVNNGKTITAQITVTENTKAK